MLLRPSLSLPFQQLGDCLELQNLRLLLQPVIFSGHQKLKKLKNKEACSVQIQLAGHSQEQPRQIHLAVNLHPLEVYSVIVVQFKL
jgi:hypothetical protein